MFNFDLFKKIFILIAGFIGCLFFAEIILHWHNPFLSKNVFTPNPLEHPPQYITVGNPENKEVKKICFAGNSFLLANQLDSGRSFAHQLMSQMDSSASIDWCMLGKENWGIEDFYKLNKWIKNYKPDALLLFVGAEAYSELLSLPNCFLQYEEEGLIFSESTRPELIKTIKFLSLKIQHANFESELWQLLPFKENSMSDSLMKLEAMQRKELNQNIAGWLKSIQQIQKTTQKLKIELTIVTCPSIYTNSNELLTSFPLSHLNLPSMMTGAIYGESHLNAVKTVKDWGKKNKNKVIDLSTRFPSDYRFYIDGIHLTEEGHTFFSSKLKNELQRIPYYKSLF